MLPDGARQRLLLAPIRRNVLVIVARNATVQSNVDLPTVRMTAAAIVPIRNVVSACYACHEH